MKKMQKAKQLEAIQFQVAQASTIADLHAIKRELVNNGNSLEFKVGFVGWAWIFLFILNLWFVVSDLLKGESLPIVPTILFIISSAFVWAIFYLRKSFPTPAALLNEVEFKACCLNNGIKKVVDSSSIESFFFKEFSEFNRGNYSRGFTEIYEGTYSSEGKEQPYYVYFFNWTDRYEQTENTTDIDGFSKYETREYFKTYYRNGFVFPLSTPAINIWQRGGLERAGQFQVASTLFNSCYNVNGPNEHQISRFLKPAVVEMILSFTGSLLQLGYESNGKGALVISTNSNPLIRYDTSNVNNLPFSQEMPLLKASIEHVKKLEFQLSAYD